MSDDEGWDFRRLSRIRPNYERRNVGLISAKGRGSGGLLFIVHRCPQTRCLLSELGAL